MRSSSHSPLGEWAYKPVCEMGHVSGRGYSCKKVEKHFFGE